MNKGSLFLILLAVVSLIGLIEIRPQPTLQASDLQYDAEHNTYVVEFFNEPQHGKYANVSCASIRYQIDFSG